MATNHLTGDYDAVVQIAVPQINALLGTLHQNGGKPDARFKLLHSVRMKVGSRRPHPEVSGFGEWVAERRRAQPAVPVPDFRGDLIDGAPPGAAARLRDMLGAF